jgi:soluble lytic murein transglycosylase-like protein
MKPALALLGMAALIGGLLLFPAPSHADIYAFVDSDGVPHFTDVPNDKRYRLYARTAKQSSDSLRLQPLVVVVSQNALRKRYAALIETAAKRYQIEAALLHAVITAESGYNPFARSSRGAKGLMQLMPGTAERYGVENIYDPEQNIQAGAQYLHDLLGQFDQDLRLALAAYNAGENAVIKHGGKVPPYRETRLYVPKVLRYYRLYQSAA